MTTAIDYVNAPPHIGHLYEKLCADAIARYYRLKGYDVFFLTGTDENASKNAKAAEEVGIPVKEFVDRNAAKFIQLCQLFNISFDYFIRTTEEKHANFVREVFKKIYEKGEIYKGIYRGLYCPLCEEFKGEEDLIDGKCPEHGVEVEYLEEENYFFRLSKYQTKILELLEKNFIIPEKRKHEVLERVRRGLKDISITRPNLTWGIKAPVNEEHTIYVWVDALFNYISAIYPENLKYWPADVHLIGKGINWFHSVLWPALLLAAGFELPKKIVVHGYLNIEGKKISKSAGNFIDPFELAQKYEVDSIRYFFLRNFPMFEDGDFREELLRERNNTELVANIGNFVYRVLSFTFTKFDGKVPQPQELNEEDQRLVGEINQIPKLVGEEIEGFRLNRALEKINEFAISCNQYFQAKRPWKTLDPNSIYLGMNAVRSLAILLAPFTPSSSQKLWRQLNLKGSIQEEGWDSASELRIFPGHIINRPEPLFKKL
ncbi:MAG: methionine--tRNA ligase [Candidatus Nanoarchaeia archaeon]|nr:methionine--tRNA ligase [Candidatus Haiyanarchaeum thermophilum]MCW1303219.1 methionine--tRNA ligase [Candidatus Haiyanarchaeum thermophilum]MCW1304049.1 methionine--tRNA ligase [Candidatus Haiyanarchaeum thermophilum]MCW1306788.1 methionine--tRNA ligase [Candidatus Haiyanarchaeum thermophilum]MCW1308224.1 methionine--tRNA ligase [Candidatus Haiyanarchaeum thermophilum]